MRIIFVGTWRQYFDIPLPIPAEGLMPDGVIEPLKAHSATYPIIVVSRVSKKALFAHNAFSHDISWTVVLTVSLQAENTGSRIKPQARWLRKKSRNLLLLHAGCEICFSSSRHLRKISRVLLKHKMGDKNKNKSLLPQSVMMKTFVLFFVAQSPPGTAEVNWVRFAVARVPSKVRKCAVSSDNLRSAISFSRTYNIPDLILYMYRIALLTNGQCFIIRLIGLIFFFFCIKA